MNKDIKPREAAELLAESYEADIDKVLREVARVQYDSQREQPRESQAVVNVAYAACSEAYKAIATTLSDEQQALLRALDDAMSLASAEDEEDAFVRGFMEGYKFLEKINKRNGGVSA